MKKIISTLTAAMAASAALTSISASAINAPSFNEYTLSTSSVENELVVDGTVVPAGSVAVTVNISNNIGFSSYSTNITLGEGLTPITNESGLLVVECGSVLNDTCICGTANGDLVNVSLASGVDNTDDGDVFIFYVSGSDEDSNTIELSAVQAEEVANSMTMADNTLSIPSAYFRVGDVDNNGFIDARDSSHIMGALSINNNVKIAISVANENLSYYFPYCPDIVCAQAANPMCPATDSDDDGIIDDVELFAGISTNYITQADALDVLRYYSCISSGQESNYQNESEGFCGRYLHT